MKKQYSHMAWLLINELLFLAPGIACATSPEKKQLSTSQTAQFSTLEQKTPTRPQAPTLQPRTVTSPNSGDFQGPPPHAFSAGVVPKQNLPLGEHHTEIQGCLAQKSRPSAKDSISRTVAAIPQDISSQPVLVNTSPGQLSLTHHLRHGCCLQAEVLRNVDKNTITVDVNLSGKTCRCMCQSQVISRFGLEPGEYQVTCLLYTSPSPRDRTRSRMPSSA